METNIDEICQECWGERIIKTDMNEHTIIFTECEECNGHGIIKT